MTRQSISITDPNDKWLKAQIETQEFSSKSEAVNALIRQARKADEYNQYVNAKLRAAEDRTKKEGYVDKTPNEMLADIKARALKNGLL